jgi:hypothetical protein
MASRTVSRSNREFTAARVDEAVSRIFHWTGTQESSLNREADRAIPRSPQFENRVVGRILDNRRVPSRYDGGKGPSEPGGCSRASGVRGCRLG